MSEESEGRWTRPGVGRDLHALRRLRGLTLAQLAEGTGRSVDFLDQAECGWAELSVDDLRALTRMLDVPVGWFFINDPAPPDEQGHVVRAHARRQVGSHGNGLLEELLSPDLEGSFEIFQSSFEPGAEMPASARRQTEEAGYLVTGELELWLDERHYHLYPGDSFRFCGQRYRWRNPGQVRTVIIWVISPPIY